MTHTLQHQAEVAQDRYGLKLAARLSAGVDDLPHDITERLRVARLQAVARRKVVRVARLRAAGGWSNSGGEASLHAGDEGLNWWSSLAALLPLLALVVGLITIQALQDSDRADELAEVDAALLTDDLPPEAYTDSGFLQYLKVADRAATAIQ